MHNKPSNAFYKVKYDSKRFSEVHACIISTKIKIVDGAVTVEPLNPLVAKNSPLLSNNVKSEVEQITNNRGTYQVFNRTSGKLMTNYGPDYG